MKPVLFVDLDESLIKTDILREQLVRSFAQDFWQTLKLVFVARFRPESIKAAICQKIDVDPVTLPYNIQVLDLISQAKADGRMVVLATATHSKVAQQVASHLGIFDGVLATTQNYNCKGKKKLARMYAFATCTPFDYVGDSAADLAIFPHCEMPVIVGNIAYPYPHKRFPRFSTFKPLAKVMHPSRWVKNTLIFLPHLFGHPPDKKVFLTALAGFTAFSLAASSVYIINDMANVESDRHNPLRKNGPFAQGEITIDEGLKTALFLLATAVLFSCLLKPVSWWIIGTYVLLTLPFFLSFKKNKIVNIFHSIVTYGLRILLGDSLTRL